jgi:hypothetical protein
MMKSRSAIGVLAFAGLSLGLAGQLPAQGNPATIYAPTEARKALVVVDSLHQVVGPLVFPGTNGFGSVADLPMVAFAVKTTQLSLRVTRDFLCGGVNLFSSVGCSGTVFYTTPDCTGQPYLAAIHALPGDLFGPVATLFNGDVSRADYYAVPDTAQRLVMGSRLERLPAETQCTAFGGSGDFMPALPLNLSQFKPPFSIR